MASGVARATAVLVVVRLTEVVFAGAISCGVVSFGWAGAEFAATCVRGVLLGTATCRCMVDWEGSATLGSLVIARLATCAVGLGWLVVGASTVGLAWAGASLDCLATAAAAAAADCLGCVGAGVGCGARI